MLTKQKFVLVCLSKPLNGRGADEYGLANDLEDENDVVCRMGSKLASFTIANLINNISYAKVPCWAAAISLLSALSVVMQWYFI